MSNMLIDMKNVSFEIDSKKMILDKINLELLHGRSLTLIGHNGAGKSSLLKLLVGDIYSTKGTVRVLDELINNETSKKNLHDLRCQIGFIHQGLHLVSRKNTLENVLMGRLPLNQSIKTWFGHFTEADYEAAYEALKTVKLHDKALLRADKLSGGERQKVAIARALAQNPKLLLADEPTAALDPKASMEVADILKNLVEEKKIGLITVVHSLDLLSKISERLVVFKSGRIIFDGNQKETTPIDLKNFYHEDQQ